MSHVIIPPVWKSKVAECTGLYLDMDIILNVNWKVRGPVWSKILPMK